LTPPKKPKVALQHSYVLIDSRFTGKPDEGTKAWMFHIGVGRARSNKPPSHLAVQS
jgi:hypothetical protein